MKMSEVLPLAEWVTFPEAADMLDVSNQAVHKMVFEADAFPGVRAVGSKPVYVLPRADVEARVRQREEALAERQARPPAVPTATLVSADEVLARSGQ